MTSVVICTYNRAEQLRRGVKTILHQNRLPDEIIIVDDGSTDNTREVAQSLSPLVKYIYVDYPEPRISCIPRNIGWREAQGNIILFTEPEALHVGNTIDQMLGKFNEDPEHSHLASQVWTIGQKIYGKLTEADFDRPERIISHEYAQLTNSENLNNVKAPDSDWAITGTNNCAAGVFFGVRRKWLEDVGGFDESFEGHGWDDFDLYERLALYGKGIVKHDDIAVMHMWHEKNYPYNIYEMAERNGKISQMNIKDGIFKINQ